MELLQKKKGGAEAPPSFYYLPEGNIIN